MVIDVFGTRHVLRDNVESLKLNALAERRILQEN